jgi:ubiquinone/menaquinone biosynthesis C-methylase UbiE
VTTTTSFDFDTAVADWWLIAAGTPHQRLRHGGAVAVVGPGSGLTALRLARALPLVTVWMSSPDPDEVEAARRAADDVGVAARCTFSVGPPDDLPVGGYDVVCLVDALRDAPDPERILRRIGRVMASDGTALVVESLPPALLEPDAGDPTALTTLLARIGLADVEVVARSDRHLGLRARRAP